VIGAAAGPGADRHRWRHEGENGVAGASALHERRAGEAGDSVAAAGWTWRVGGRFSCERQELQTPEEPPSPLIAQKQFRAGGGDARRPDSRSRRAADRDVVPVARRGLRR